MQWGKYMVMAVPIKAPFEHTLKTKTRAELAVFNQLLSLLFQDPVTQCIDAWHGKFIEALRTLPAEEVDGAVARFEHELQAILVDPLTHSSLEKISYLGSDGQVYGKRALHCYLNELPESRKGRSPFKVDSDELFTIMRHPIIEGAVQWLRNHNIHTMPLASITERYKSLKGDSLLPELPTDLIKVKRQERVRQLVQRQRETERKEIELKERAKEESVRNARSYVDASLHGLNVMATGTGDSDLLAEKEADWTRRNAVLTERIDALNARVEMIWEGVSQAEKSAALLEENIRATERAIEDRKSRAENNVWGSIAQVVAMAAVSAITGVSIYQPSGGGIGITKIWRI